MGYAALTLQIIFLLAAFVLRTTLRDALDPLASRFGSVRRASVEAS